MIEGIGDPNYIFSIDQHTLTIIETDGTNVKPIEVSQVQIFAGQRYSFVVRLLLDPTRFRAKFCD